MLDKILFAILLILLSPLFFKSYLAVECTNKIGESLANEDNVNQCVNAKITDIIESIETFFMVIGGVVILVLIVPPILKLILKEIHEEYINSNWQIQNNLNELKIAQEKLQEAYDNMASFREGSSMYNKFQNELTYWANKRRIAEKKVLEDKERQKKIILAEEEKVLEEKRREEERILAEKNGSSRFRGVATKCSM